MAALSEGLKEKQRSHENRLVNVSNKDENVADFIYVTEDLRRKLWKDPVNSKWPKHPQSRSVK